MNGVIPDPDNEVKLLTEKWHSYTRQTPVDRMAQVSIMLESQCEALKTLSQKTKDHLIEVLGDTWDEAFLYGYVRALNKCTMFEMFAVQPVTKPVAKVAYYERSVPRGKSAVDALAELEDKPEIPEIHFDLKLDEARAQSRSVGSFLVDALADCIALHGNPDSVLSSFFEEALDQVQRELLGLMLNAEGIETVFTDDTDTKLVEGARKAMYIVHERTKRGPANNLVSGTLAPRLGQLQSRAHVRFDPLFPEQRVLAFYNGASVLDSAVIWCPLHFTFTLDHEAVPLDKCGDTVKQLDVLRMTIRHSYRVSVDHAAVIEVKRIQAS